MRSKGSTCTGLLERASVLLLVSLLPACSTATYVDNTPGRATSYEPLTQPSRVTGGVGIEGNDIVSMTDQMMRDMLANHLFAAAASAPRVIVDSAYFVNEGSTPINKNLITDRLRVELSRAAAGRMLFVGRENIRAVESEKELKRQGVVDSGTLPNSSSTAGADYRLTGRINTLDKIDARSGARARYNQIVFEMVDLDKGYIVWSGLYEFQKSGQDDIIYQ